MAYMIVANGLEGFLLTFRYGLSCEFFLLQKIRFSVTLFAPPGLFQQFSAFVRPLQHENVQVCSMVRNAFQRTGFAIVA